MKKILFSLFLITVLMVSMAVPAGAFNINTYELHHKAGLIAYPDTDSFLYENNADLKIYPASIAKLMTAVVMVENIEDFENEYIVYSKEALNRILGTGSAVYAGDGLKVGEKMKAREALAALLITSSGDVAYAISEHVGGSTERFVEMMNEKAKEMGLDGTHYTNPVGLHDDNLYTTARDIYYLAKYAFSIDEIKSLLTRTSYKFEATNFHNEITLPASNLMINPNSNVYYRYAVCGKTGFTSKAGRCLVSMAEYNGYTYIAVVLDAKTINGARNEFIDTANMFRWAFNNFEYKSILESTTPVTEAPLRLSSEFDYLPICFEGGLKTILPKEADASTIEYNITLNQPEFTAPIEKGAVVGSADIFYAEEKIGTLNLVAGQSIKASPVLVFLDSAKTVLTSTPMKIVYLALVLVIVIFAVAVLLLNKGKKKNRRVKYVPLSKEERDDIGK